MKFKLGKPFWYGLLFLVTIVSLFIGLALLANHYELKYKGLTKNPFLDTYQKDIRSTLFTSLITIGSFLLTLKTAILQRLKYGFDSKRYSDRFEYTKLKKPSISYYGSLKRLSKALAFTILACFVSSILQMTLGFVDDMLTIMICLFCAALSICSVLYLTIQMFLAHDEWFEKIEEDRVAPRPNDSSSKDI